MLDIIQNSVEAGSERITAELREDDSSFSCLVRDNGCGMSAEVLGRVLDPFSSDRAKHASRKVGLGLPFLVQSVEAANGMWTLESEPGRGTLCRFSFDRHHVDCPAPGDIPGLVLSACLFPGAYELEFVRSLCRNESSHSYSVLRSELEEAAGGLVSAGSLFLVRLYLREQEEELQRMMRSCPSPVG